MIEELKLLIPLFESVTSGALWALAAYIAYAFFKIGIVVFGVIYIAKLIVDSVNRRDIVNKIAVAINFSDFNNLYDYHRAELLRRIKALKEKADK